MRVNKFVWNKDNLEHISKHYVNSIEVEKVFDGKFIVRKTKEGMYLAWGQAYNGRYLFIVFRSLGKGNIKVITARDMMDKDKKFYLRRVK